MAETNNYNLYKPVAGESGWADAINGNFDTIDSQMKSNQDSIANHTGTGSNKHNANQIKTASGSNVEDEISALKTGKSDINHTHLAENIIMPDSLDVAHHIAQINSDIDTINNTLNLLLPDLTSVTISAIITNESGGIRIMCNTQLVINISYWAISVAKKGNIILEMTSSSNYESSLTGVEDSDVLDITITAYSGLSTKVVTYSHTFHHIDTDLENRLYNIETQLTIGNIIDAFAQDQDALQALANVLHSSNTLAQKIAELS